MHHHSLFLFFLLGTALRPFCVSLSNWNLKVSPPQFSFSLIFLLYHLCRNLPKLWCCDNGDDGMLLSRILSSGNENVPSCCLNSCDSSWCRLQFTTFRGWNDADWRSYQVLFAKMYGKGCQVVGWPDKEELIVGGNCWLGIFQWNLLYWKI